MGAGGGVAPNWTTAEGPASFGAGGENIISVSGFGRWNSESFEFGVATLSSLWMMMGAGPAGGFGAEGTGAAVGLIPKRSNSLNTFPVIGCPAGCEGVRGEGFGAGGTIGLGVSFGAGTAAASNLSIGSWGLIFDHPFSGSGAFAGAAAGVGAAGVGTLPIGIGVGMGFGAGTAGISIDLIGGIGAGVIFGGMGTTNFGKVPIELTG